MVSQTVEIKNASGLHLRPAGFLCKYATQFDCKVHIYFQDTQVNAKSVLSILGACIKCGDTVTFQCDGPDEDEALKKMIYLADHGFDELME